jgi:hypothetical protein
MQAQEIINLFSSKKKLPLKAGGSFVFDRLFLKNEVIEIIKGNKTIAVINSWNNLDAISVKRSGAQLIKTGYDKIPEFELVNKEQDWVYKPTASPVSAGDIIGYSLWSAIENAKKAEKSDGVFIKISGSVKTAYGVSRITPDVLGLVDANRALIGAIRTLSASFLMDGVWSQVGKMPIRQICLNTAGETAKDLAEKYTIKTLLGRKIRSIEVLPEIARQAIFGMNHQSSTPSVNNFDIVATGACDLQKINTNGTYEIMSSSPFWKKDEALPSGMYTPVWPLQLKEKENEIIILPIIVPFGKLLNNFM